MPEHEYTVERRTAEVLRFRIGSEYAVFTIENEPERRRYGLGIESSYGGYACAWTHPGEDFKSFLAGLDLSYVLGKMVGRDDAFDGQATADSIRKEIWLARRYEVYGPMRSPGYYGEGMDAETARAEWDSVPDAFDSEVEFDRWQGDTEFFKSEEPWRFYQTGPGQRSCEFRGLYEMFWGALGAELRKDLAGAAA